MIAGKRFLPLGDEPGKWTTMTMIVRTAAAVALAASVSALAAPASAGEWRRGPYGPYYARGSGISPGAAAAVGILGGLAVGSAIAANARPAPVYVRPQRVYEDKCYVERRRVWVPGWGWEVRRRTICE